MSFKQYTQCFQYPSGGKPYNEKNRAAFVVEQVLLALTITGGFTLVGLLAGPLGAIIFGIMGSLIGFTNLISTAADQWLNHRLICLGGGDPQCAVGIVSYDPTRSDLGVFDNDQYFDVVLMPHPVVSISADFDPVIQASSGTALVPKNRYNADGSVVKDFAGHVADHPDNNILTDGFQGETWLSTRADIAAELGYATPDSHERSALHCEAEGDFWLRMQKLAPALAALIVATVAVTAAGAEAGSAIGSTVGCVLLSFFFGALGCTIGGFLGGLLGGAAGGAAAGAATYYGVIQPTLQAIFDASPGDVEDANVGDKSLGPITMGDTVAVLGLHVYDGYHQGWNEFHPLMAVVKIGKSSRVGLDFYLEWQPDFSGELPPVPPGETVLLTPEDMREGLNSVNFRTRCKNLQTTWCSMLNDAFSGPTRKTQQGLEQRWTIHPMVDGCLPPASGPGGLH